MCNLNEVEEVDDPAMQWAIVQEFALRHRRYERAKEGLIGVTKRVALQMNRLQEAFAGMSDVEA